MVQHLKNFCKAKQILWHECCFVGVPNIVRKFGSVYKGGEGGLHVMYLAGGFKANMTSGRLWLCTQTIIHEAAHIAIGAKDILYDKDGLKPRPGFNREAAVQNADSWGYFALDLADYLSPSDFRRIWSDFGS